MSNLAYIEWKSKHISQHISVTQMVFVLQNTCSCTSCNVWIFYVDIDIFLFQPSYAHIDFLVFPFNSWNKVYNFYFQKFININTIKGKQYTNILNVNGKIRILVHTYIKA